MVIEQKGRDVWRGRHKLMADAIEDGIGCVGVDRVLLTRAREYGVTTVMVVVEEQRCVFLAPVEIFLTDPDILTRANYQGRAQLLLGYERWVKKYLGPAMSRKKRV